MLQVDDRTRRARLVARHHLSRSADTVVQATRDLVALHSSDPLTPHLALRARVVGYRTSDLDTALADDRSLWRLHAMRRTLWVAAADEVPTLDGATGADIARKEHRRLLGWVRAEREDAEAWLDKLKASALEAVEERPGITTRELTSAIPELSTKVTVGSGKWTSEVAVGSRLLYVLAMELRLRRTDPSGSWKSSQYGWRVAGPVERADPAPARARLVRRYLQRFGPATETDIAWWTGLTKARTRKALTEAGAVAVELERGEGWVDAEDVMVAAAAPAGAGNDPSQSAADTEAASRARDVGEPTVSLLPGLDPTPMGYKERDWYLGPHEDPLFDRNGNIGPTIWLDGRIVGGWAVCGGGTVAVRLLQDVGADAEARVAREAANLEGWLDGTVITPRFRTPLEREVVG